LQIEAFPQIKLPEKFPEKVEKNEVRIVTAKSIKT
jgi:hypothetical protein